MPVWLSVLIFIFAGLLIVNATAYFVLWKMLRNDLFKWSAIAWTFNFLNFLVHGLVDGKSVFTLVGHSMFFITSLCLSQVLAVVSGSPYSFKRYFKIYPLILFISVMIFYIFKIKYHYFWAALILDISIAFPLFKISFFVLKDVHQEKTAKIFALLLFVNGLHFLDYPFIDIIPRELTVFNVNLFNFLTLFGFSFAFFLSILIAIVLPLLIFEMKAKTYQRELENAVNLKTAELEKYNEKLEESNLDNQALVALVCHDIATPLMVMQNHLKKIYKFEDSLSKEVKLSVDKINTTFLSLSDLLKRVREMHAGKLGKFNPQFESVNPEIIINEVVDSFQPKAQEKSIQLTVKKTYDKSIKIKIDQMVFKNQILGNLLSNAIKFSNPKTEIAVILETHLNKFELKVIDHGVGIQNKNLSDLFKYNQSTTTEGTFHEKGTGLGLPTVKTMTERLGGQIFINSFYDNGQITEHTGTTFNLVFDVIYE